MKIETIRIENFKTFKKAEIKNLPQMVVLLGPNGSGKSTFFDVFGFLNDALKNNVTTAIDSRGGFEEVISRGCDATKDLIKFEIQFRNSSTNKDKTPLITYLIEIGFNQTNGKSYIAREVLKYRRGQKSGKPWHFLDFSNGLVKLKF
jgi:predicted ATPase